jgi:hypothetical protein
METKHVRSRPVGTFGKDVWLGLVSGLVNGFVFQRIGRKYLVPWLPIPVVVGLSVLLLVSGLVAVAIAHKRSKRDRPGGQAIRSWLQHSIIYWLALDLSLFGWQKILKLQMIVPLGMLDTPFSSLSGETLVWAFYRWSYPFTVAIALLQLGAGYLLLFARTRLLALLLLVPMLVNIIGLDYFYDMPIWVLLHALVLLTGVVYLLSLHASQIRAFLRSTIDGLLPSQLTIMTRNGLKLSVFLLPVLFFATYEFPDKHPELTGKYQLTNITINDTLQVIRSPKDSVLSVAYLDLGNDFVLDFNDYRFRYIGTYQYQPATDSLVVNWRYPAGKSPLIGTLTKEGTSLRFTGVMAGKKLAMMLRK